MRRPGPQHFYARVMRLLAILLLGLLALPAGAMESEAVRSPRASVSLVTDRAAIAPGEQFAAGLLLRLAPGWHSYWRNAGDAGAAPEISFTLPAGAAASGFDWPAPTRIPQPPLMSFGYAGEVLLPLRLTAPETLKPGEVFSIEAEASWLVCAELCIPEEGRFRLAIPVGSASLADPRQAARFAAAEAALSRASPWSAEAIVDGSRARLALRDTPFGPGTVREAAFFPNQGGLIDNAAPQPLRLRDGTVELGLTWVAEAPVPTSLDGALVLTDAQGARSAFEISAPVRAGTLIETAPLLQVMLAALLGGVLLNLMPCVFPVLAMKAMALARMSCAGRAQIRAEAASYTAGVMVSMLALAGLLLALRASGVAIGWGFQLTMPGFVAALAWLMLAVGLNLSGVFQVGGTVGLGGTLAARGGHFGSFATGALAVLVATPCTGPFMAAAIGTAFALPATGTIAVFTALGFGLALPYALLGLFPGLARLLPKPGAWMEWLRQGLAFPMYAAAAWLAWVLAQQVGADGLGLLLAGSVLIGLSGWAVGIAQRGARRAGWLAGLALAAAVALLPGFSRVVPAEPGLAAGIEAWSAERVAALQAEGRPVFVNLTAAWCITCKVNEHLVLRTTPVQAAFARRGFATLTGDWTNGDAAIGALLREHGREGVPLYLMYPAGGGPPVLLPQVLTEGIMLQAIEAAG